MSIVAAGCDGFHYHPETQHRTAEVGEFSGIALDGVGNVVVYLNAPHKVVVTSHTDVVNNITTKVDDNDILRIDTKDNAQVNGKGPINIEVHAPSITNVELFGNGYIKFVSGKPNGSLSKSASGSTRAPRLYIKHDGVGDIDAQECAADTVVVKHYGNGSVAVTADSILNVAIAAKSGVVIYGGNPRIRIPVENVPVLDIPNYAAAFNEELWVAGGDARIKGVTGYYFHHTFEDGTTQGWTRRFGAGTVSNTSDHKAGGSRSLYMSDPMFFYDGPALELDPKVFVPGNEYSFSILAMFADGPEVGNFMFGLQYDDINDSTIYHPIGWAENVPRGEWVTLANKNIPIPAGAANIFIYVEMPVSDGAAPNIPNLPDIPGLPDLSEAPATANFYIDDAMGGVAGAEAPGRQGATFP